MMAAPIPPLERARLRSTWTGTSRSPIIPRFEFASGNGTIEALIYMSQALSTEPTIFAQASDRHRTTPLYAVRASANGNNLL